MSEWVRAGKPVSTSIEVVDIDGEAGVSWQTRGLSRCLMVVCRCVGGLWRPF
jgi:hypothetical protein